MKTPEEIETFVKFLTEDEIKVVRFLAEKYKSREFVMIVEWPISQEKSSTQDLNARQRIKQKLHDFGCFVHVKTPSGMEFTPVILQVLDRIDNPPPPDHWANLLTWWRSKRWSVPVTLVVVIVPILAGWSQAVMFFIERFTSSK